jgi:large subunit ribosomal protein L25
MDIILLAEAREKKEKLSPDFVPAVLYGHGIASSSLKVNRQEIDKVVHLAGESNLITLKYDGTESKVLIKEAQRSGMNGKLLNIDFFQVNMKDKITTEIPLHFVGESRAVREMSGSLIKDLDFLEVECLPSALVDHIDVDISSLNNYHDEISVKDLVLPVGMKLTHDANRIIVSVIPPRAQEAIVEVAPVAKTVVKEEPKTEK